MIEFVSYDGRYPNYCSGCLTIKVDGKEYKLESILCSGGRVWFGENWEEHVESGPWTIFTHYLPEELRPRSLEIEEVVNANVHPGCCGGCV